MTNRGNGSTTFPRVAIIGAGLAGCTLARLLTQSCASVVVCEGEASLSDRGQGGTLDIHDSTGLAALRRCGLLDSFRDRARLDGDALRLDDKYGRTWVRVPSSGTELLHWTGNGRPEIDRVALREMLVESLPPVTIRWGHRLKNLDPDADEPRNSVITFGDGSNEAGFDLIVGAEGTWSKVRRVLTQDKPLYSGIGGFDGFIPNAKNIAPSVHSIVSNGSWFNYGDGKFVSDQQLSNGSIWVGAYRVQSEDWQTTTSLNTQDGTTALDTRTADLFRDWNPNVRALLGAVEPATVTARNIYSLPTGFSWPNRRGINLIGDAAHVIPPFTGGGVNAAMKDTLDLADAILEVSTSHSDGKSNTDSLYRATEIFERRMYKHVTRLQKCT